MIRPLAHPAATPGVGPVADSEASEPREAAASPGPFRAVLVTAGELDASIGETAERSGDGARGPAIWDDRAGADSASALDEDVALAQAAAQAATGARVTAAAHPPGRVTPHALPRATESRRIRSTAIESSSAVSAQEGSPAQRPRRPSLASDPSPSASPPPAALARESSIRTISALAIATASREADAIASNASANHAAAATEPGAGHAPPGDASTAIARTRTGGTTAAMLGRPVVATHRVPAGFARTVPAGNHRLARTVTEPAAEALAESAPAFDGVTDDITPALDGVTDDIASQVTSQVFSQVTSQDSIDALDASTTAGFAHDDSPSGTWLSIATPRTASRFGSWAREPSGPTPSITPMPVVDPSANSLTPLERAVHDLIGRLGHDDIDQERAPRTSPTRELGSELMLVQVPTTQQPALNTHTQPVSRPARTRLPSQPPEPLANPSHVHLVVDDGPERVVVTVAMRGNDVHVALRGSDDATTAALARNAATLDHAMRARGLVLGELTIEREAQPRSRHQSEPPPPPPQKNPDAEPFELEETP